MLHDHFGNLFFWCQTLVAARTLRNAPELQHRVVRPLSLIQSLTVFGQPCDSLLPASANQRLAELQLWCFTKFSPHCGWTFGSMALSSSLSLCNPQEAANFFSRLELLGRLWRFRAGTFGRRGQYNSEPHRGQDVRAVPSSTRTHSTTLPSRTLS